MCERIAALRQSVEDYSCGFDAALVTGAQADEVLCAAAAIEKAAAALKAAAAARVAATSVWRRSGARSPAEHLAPAGLRRSCRLARPACSVVALTLPELLGMVRRGAGAATLPRPIADSRPRLGWLLIYFGRASGPKR